jgi:hypothetical protein
MRGDENGGWSEVLVRRCDCENPDVPHACPQFDAAYREYLAGHHRTRAVGPALDQIQGVGVMERIARIATVAGAGLGVLLACLLAFGYTVGGGYFPGGPMFFPGDDVPVQMLVVVGLWAIVGIACGMSWLWFTLAPKVLPDKFVERVADAAFSVVFFAVFSIPFVFVVGLLTWMLIAEG